MFLHNLHFPFENSIGRRKERGVSTWYKGLAENHKEKEEKIGYFGKTHGGLSENYKLSNYEKKAVCKKGVQKLKFEGN